MTSSRRVVLAVAAVGALAVSARWLFEEGVDWHQLLGHAGVPNSCRLVLESPELDPADFRITFYSDDGDLTVFDGRTYRSFPGVYGSQGFYVDHRGRRIFGSNDFSPMLGGIRYWIRCRSEGGVPRCREQLDGERELATATPVEEKP